MEILRSRSKNTNLQEKVSPKATFSTSLDSLDEALESFGMSTDLHQRATEYSLMAMQTNNSKLRNHYTNKAAECTIKAEGIDTNYSNE
jgi:alcohol dehydrogenase class IV